MNLSVLEFIIFGLFGKEYILRFEIAANLVLLGLARKVVFLGGIKVDGVGKLGVYVEVSEDAFEFLVLSG